MKQQFQVLIVDDDPDSLSQLRGMLERQGLAVWACAGVDCALDLLAEREFDLVMTDLRTGGRGELAILTRTRELHPASVVIIITGSSSVDRAVEAMRRGAFHYLTKPYRLDEVRVVVDKALEKRMLKLELSELRDLVRHRLKGPRLIGENPSMQELKKLISRVAPLDSTVLIRGETGTGKELVARLIHDSSHRADKPFLAVNCGGLSEDLLRNELFGHEKEAFTGAHTTRKGVFEAASGGTLLLDEIGELPIPMQSQLLRVLQEKTVTRVGGVDEIPVDVRFLAATNAPLQNAVNTGRFRQDLYYRLNVITMRVPSLRDRKDDIPLFCAWFVDKYATQFGREVDSLSDQVLDVFMDYEWPGNVRELENVIERAVALAEGPVIEPRHLPGRLGRGADKSVAPTALATLAQVEAGHIRKVLAHTGGNKTRAARILGIDRTSLWRKLKAMEPHEA
jgi:DNA-binding NtrC family response regulator